MARVSGVNIPNEKRIVIALTYIFGIGPTRAQKVLKTAGIEEKTRTKDLTEADLDKLRGALGEFTLEGDLKREVLTNIRRHKTIGTYRGTRHAKRLPCRGQRTKTNNRTVRGNKRNTMGSGKIAISKT
jgi:small subunit ribosomal protein S13